VWCSMDPWRQLPGFALKTSWKCHPLCFSDIVHWCSCVWCCSGSPISLVVFLCCVSPLCAVQLGGVVPLCAAFSKAILILILIRPHRRLYGLVLSLVHVRSFPLALHALSGLAGVDVSCTFVSLCVSSCLTPAAFSPLSFQASVCACVLCFVGGRV